MPPVAADPGGGMPPPADVTRHGSSRALPRLLLVLAAALLAARIGTAMFERAHPSAVKDAIAWREIGDAETLARQKSRPILYEFSAAWCGPCQLMQNEVFADPRTAEQIEHAYVPVRVVDRQREDGRNPLDVQALETRFHIRAFPTLVVADPDSGEVGRIEGYPGRDEVAKQLAETATRLDLKHGRFRTGGFVIK